ncbi:MAG: hypothetical protein U9M92_02475 [Patescibacteria group bacterium]|nr:hypothetical protein [Patescibacteria group bacterium]
MTINSTALVRQDRPAWYELTLGSKGQTIGIRIHWAVWPALISYLRSGAAGIRHRQERFDLPDFVPPEKSRAWGFSEVLSPMEEDDPENWQGWNFELPTLLTIHSPDKARVKGLTIMRCIRSTLELLLGNLLYWEGNTGATGNQLLLINGLGAGIGREAAGFDVDLSPAIIRWLAHCPDEARLIPIKLAMIQADAKMCSTGTPHTGRHWDFEASCQRGKWLMLRIPGSACTLGPGEDRRAMGAERPDRGYTLSSHNIDAGTDQLTLLAGLAKLCELVRLGPPRQEYFG